MKQGKRKICVVVTARPSYSRIKTVLKAINEHPKLELQLVVAGSALLDRYGNAADYIIKDGFTITEKVFMVLEGENPTAMAKTTGLGVMELSNVFYNLQPDAVITIADRFETIATSIAAAYQNIPLVHIQGGEVTGNIDEKVRHANTKLADIHLVASEDAKARVVKLGEDEECVFNTGCPSIDIANDLLQIKGLDFNPIEKYGGVGGLHTMPKNYLVVLQHPVTNEYLQAKADITKTLQVINRLKIPTFWFWPNVDAGADGTSNGIRSFREQHNPKHIRFFKNMDSVDFLKLLKHSQCLIGNSSVGIRECSFLGVPVVNIGTRQHRRQRGTNVIDVMYNEAEIQTAIEQQLKTPKNTRSTIYGKGDSGQKIAEILAKVKFKFHKTIQY
ncbi:UDP-N-acetylglucosamine 2-epimerase [Meridianimaribacter flavus]|uniref:UDP-N-acetylglucosamine 2-epimerase/UDP-hydrolysing UDP-N-acetyl-D-glucosamine 2-epimerase,TIGR03568 n=1 Tax=Meridianimaribacter flavus TaxID=571115 RepID=A0ABY2G5L5_9FLAO|nr:UDP-N-acetylglucosamine 2-epimerase [Meridianimaribacter flavus]TDY11782.1 UDP-N-acetylglucosamine 2-epimerase/UDP-hydrolysing UDP-N-acetyl-D-glucosamine 2-epimerase,TIGR03568 [Meridianimaribacter flavus]